MSKITSFQMMCWPLMCSLSGSKIKWEQKRSVPESPVTRGRKFVLCSYKVKKKMWKMCYMDTKCIGIWRWFGQYRQYFSYVLLVTILDFYWLIFFLSKQLQDIKWRIKGCTGESAVSKSKVSSDIICRVK